MRCYFSIKVLTYCRGQPVVLTDRGEWYDWPLHLPSATGSEKREEVAPSSKHGSVC